MIKDSISIRPHTTRNRKPDQQINNSNTRSESNKSHDNSNQLQNVNKSAVNINEKPLVSQFSGSDNPSSKFMWNFSDFKGVKIKSKDIQDNLLENSPEMIRSNLV